jgi:HJR/Mrr/RecB family endonuclease
MKENENINLIINAIKEFENIYYQLQDSFSLAAKYKYFDYEQKVEDRVSNKMYYSSLKNSYISENDLLVEFSEFILLIRKYIEEGDFFALKNRISDITNICSIDFVSKSLFDNFGKYGEEIIFDIDSIINSISFDEYFENIISEVPEVIKDLTEEMMFQISNNPDLIYNIDPFVFEEFIAKILTKFKMQVQLQKKTRDKGIDIIAFKDDFYTKNYYIFECKRYTPPKKVGLDIVQRLYGVKQWKHANKAFLVTSTLLTKDATEFCEQHCFDLQIVDYQELLKWLKTAYQK